MGLNGPAKCRRRLLGAGACAAALIAPGCSAHESPAGPASPSFSVRTTPRLDSGSLQQVADALVERLRCDDRDEYRDDLTFWDEMRGYDCVDAANTVSVRVYGSADSVGQVLAPWADSLSDGSAVRRGANWFVIGPAERIAQARPPRGAPEIEPATGSVASSTDEQEFLTNCAQYTLDEAVRMIRDERVPPADGEYYAQAFRGVESDVRDSIGRPELDRLRAVGDQDRWHAMLSPHGQTWKASCRTAMRQHEGLGDRGDE